MVFNKRILLFGAGKSATVLIDYLKKKSIENQWQFIVADANLAVVQKNRSDCSLQSCSN